ncbi:RcpC/CpaB family pilus assembly protein [Rhodococcus ruber]|uniref:RcpC/CpaB family pilus assembly protein n=1 Tax=Rhodococcus ruber TaxID=1830 RepID=UPI0011202F8F|nr:RcpC/CpaB family pilus assembly protein [Rhodococcus ruber]QDC13611.1 flagellar biosynthesis protein FlgA [Rhodococcus ruber]QRE80130.1 flagellar biosynthesis protein FlgA [Rhodococcus ruber]
MPAGPFSFPHLRNPLDPTLTDRLTALTRPGWARTVAVRRAIAAGLVGVAAVSAVTGGASDDRTRTVVAARDLRPGQTLTVDDVIVIERDASQLPSGALTDPAEALGHTLAGPVPSGEVLVGVRMLGPRLAAATTGDSAARVVPVRLADPGVGDLLREGDLVDVLTVADASAPSAPEVRVLATGATVVLAQGTEETNIRGEKVVLLALPPEPATAVAAASLVSALTVTLH